MTTDEKALTRNREILKLRGTVEKNSPEYMLKIFDQGCSAMYALTYVVLALIAYVTVTNKEARKAKKISQEALDKVNLK